MKCQVYVHLNIHFEQFYYYNVFIFHKLSKSWYSDKMKMNVDLGRIILAYFFCCILLIFYFSVHSALCYTEGVAKPNVNQNCTTSNGSCYTVMEFTNSSVATASKIQRGCWPASKVCKNKCTTNEVIKSNNLRVLLQNRLVQQARRSGGRWKRRREPTSSSPWATVLTYFVLTKIFDW